MAVSPTTTTPPAPTRIERYIIGLAAAFAGLTFIDLVLFAIWDHGLGVKGLDWALMGVAPLFLLACRLVPRRVRGPALMLLVLLVVALVMELGLAAANLMRPGPRRGTPWYVWPPNYTRLVMPGDNLLGVAPEGRFSTNSRGIRGPEFSDDDRYRILCIGGSTTECLYLDDTRAWPAVLGEQLNSQVGPGIWVGNVGRSGLTSADHVTLVRHLPEADMADCWLVLCGINDMGYHVRGVYQRSKAQTWGRTFRYRRPGLSTPLRRPWYWNLHLVNMLDQLRRQWRTVRAGNRQDVYQDARAVWTVARARDRAAAKAAHELPDLASALREYEAVLTELIDAARAKGKRLVLITQPTAYGSEMDPALADRVIGGERADGTYYTIELMAQAMAQFNRVMLDLAERRGVECVDLASLLPRTAEVFYDDCHFNDHGARLVAEALAPVLIRGLPPALAPRNRHTADE